MWAWLSKKLCCQGNQKVFFFSESSKNAQVTEKENGCHGDETYRKAVIMEKVCVFFLEFVTCSSDQAGGGVGVGGVGGRWRRPRLPHS